MAVARLDPFKELEEMERRLASMFGCAPVRHANGQETMTVAEWAPLVDVVESDNEYLIQAELPGLKREDVEVTVRDGSLIISGERAMEKEEEGKKYHRVERAYGHFARSFTLPEDTDPARIRAEVKDGVLNIHIPKAEHARPKRIEVEVA